MNIKLTSAYNLVRLRWICYQISENSQDGVVRYNDYWLCSSPPINLHPLLLPAPSVQCSEWGDSMKFLMLQPQSASITEACQVVRATCWLSRKCFSCYSYHHPSPPNDQRYRTFKNKVNSFVPGSSLWMIWGKKGDVCIHCIWLRWPRLPGTTSLGVSSAVIFSKQIK